MCQTIEFVFEKLLKSRGSIFSERLHRAQADEVKALNLIVFMFGIYLFSALLVTALKVTTTIPLRNVTNIAANA